MKKTEILVFDKVSASYDKGKHFCLSEVSFCVMRGQTAVIIGPNGSGKTTLLKMISGLVKASEGKVEVGCTPKEIGYIPQHKGLVPMLSALDNVLMGALNRIGFVRSLFKKFPAEEVKYAKQLIVDLGLEAKTLKKVSQLSGGEKRRVAIARALMQRPKLLLADEILSDLDFVKAKRIMEMLKELKGKYDLTIVMVEHDLCVANEFGDEIVFLKEGRLMPKLNTCDYELFFQPI